MEDSNQEALAEASAEEQSVTANDGGDRDAAEAGGDGVEVAGAAGGISEVADDVADSGEKMDTMSASAAGDEEEIADYVDNEVYKNLRAQNVKPKVVAAIIELYETTEMTPEDIDERAIEMIRSLPIDHAIFVLKEIKESNLLGVQNKAQFITSTVRNFRDKTRQLGTQAALSQPLISGPSAEKIKEILARTGYPLEVTQGQRKYGGPPPDWEGPATGPTGSGHECYVGKIPKEIYEDTIITLFEQCGKIWDLRLMMDPLTGKNRGYAFVTFCERSAASEAAKKYDGYEILPGKNLKVNISVANTRLFIGNIPKSKSKEEILAEFREHAEGVVDCIIYSSPDFSENRRNRGFCFMDFCDHKSASDAKRKIHAGKLRPWNSDLVVDWAEPQEEPDDETMAKVKVLYVRNLKEAVTEEQLKEMFSAHGEVDRAKKIRDYAFIHFVERDPAVKAMEALNGTVLEGVAIAISLAKPQGDKKKMMRGRGRGFGMRGDFGGFSATGGFGARGGVRGRGGPGVFGGGYGTPAAYGAAGAYGGYDPYGGYDEFGYTPGGYGAYPSSGYESYSYPDPYGGYGAYGASPSAGGRGRGLQPGFTQRGSAGRSRPGRGVVRGPSVRGLKRPGDAAGGPVLKRDFTDFSADSGMPYF